MANNTADQFNPFVVELGDAYIDKIHYKGGNGTNAADSYKAGELIRITNDGLVQAAALDSDTAGAVHGMALIDVTAQAKNGVAIPILRFAENTILRIQVYNATASSAEPQDVAVGSRYELRRNSNKYSMTTTTTKGIAIVHRKPSDSGSFDEYRDADRDYGVVDIKFAQSLLEGNAAATA
jgi:hypothetical protein